MKRRNMSILAHGFEPVSRKLWEEARDWIDVNIVHLIMRNENMPLPEQLPSNSKSQGSGRFGIPVRVKI